MSTTQATEEDQEIERASEGHREPEGRGRHAEPEGRGKFEASERGAQPEGHREPEGREARDGRQTGATHEAQAAREARTARKSTPARQMNMTEGPLLGNILLFALPLALSSMLQQLFNTADTMVTGQLVGNTALAGVGGCSPIINLLVNLFTGLSVGANVIIAIYVGRKEEAKVCQAVHTTAILAVLSGAAVALIGLLCAEPLLYAIATPGNAMPDALTYLRIYFCGMPFMMIYNFGSAILRSKGDTRRPLWCLAVGSALNVGLDLLAVSVLELGVAGVAAGTLVSYAVSAALIVVCLLREEGPFRLRRSELRLTRRHLSDILKMGVPAGLQGAIFSFSNLVIQSGINSFGEAAMSGSAAEVNYEFAGYFVCAAFASAAVTFTSQNFAVRRYDRCKRVFALCMTCGVVSTGILSAIFAGKAELLIGLCAPEEQACALGVDRMLLVAAFEWVTCSYEVSAGALRGMKRSLLPTCIILFGTVVIRMIFFFTVFAANPSYDLLMHVYLGTWIPTGVAMNVALFLVARKAFKTPAAQPRAAA